MEETFKISIGTADVLDFSSYEKGKEILAKYGVELCRWRRATAICWGGGRAVVIDPNDPRGRWSGWRRWVDAGTDLLTHEHCDHMAGLEALRNRWPGWVAATAACSAGSGTPGST